MAGVSGRPGEAPAYSGTDFIIARTAGFPPFIFFFRQAIAECSV